MPISKTQIDRLGDRLKGGPHTESDLRLLDDYRRSFGEAYEAVVRTIRQLGEFPTGRLAKSTLSIVEKLRRESIRLSQMQDIAGCRVVVKSIVEQDRFVASLSTDFPGASIIDRRESPSHGYRAVHIIVEVSGMPIEIQVRSSLQHLWAEVSEKSSDVLDPTIKYGGGSESWRDFLTQSSEAVSLSEGCEKTTSRLVTDYEEFGKKYSEAVAYKEVADATIEKFQKIVVELPGDHVPDNEVEELRGKLENLTRETERLKKVLQESQARLVRQRNVLTDLLTTAITRLDKLKELQQ